MTDHPDAVKVAREAVAARAEEGGFNCYADDVRAGREDKDASVKGAILGARAMQEALPAPDPSGWIVGNADGDKWRRWDEAGIPIWTRDRNEATRYARRKDAEDVHREDEDVWRVVPYAVDGAGAAMPTPAGAGDLVERHKLGSAKWADIAECSEWAVVASVLRDCYDQLPTFSSIGVALKIAEERAKNGWRTYDSAASPAAPGAEVEPVAKDDEVQQIAERLARLSPDCGILYEGPDYQVRLQWVGPETQDISPPTTDAIRAQARRGALEECGAWHDDQAALHDAQGEACGTGTDGWKRHAVAAADHRRSAIALRRLAGKPGEAEGWRSLDDCPNDGSLVWVAGGRYSSDPEIQTADGNWCRSEAKRGSKIVPNVWMPLNVPVPPSAQGGRDAGN